MRLMKKELRALFEFINRGCLHRAPEEEVLPGSARSSAGPSSLLHCHPSCKSDPCRDLEMLLVYGARGPPLEAKGNSRPLVAGRDLKCAMPEVPDRTRLGRTGAVIGSRGKADESTAGPLGTRTPLWRSRSRRRYGEAGSWKSLEDWTKSRCR